MDRKFIIILLATIFYNGVTQSSPVGQQTSDARLPEEKPPTIVPPTVGHLNKTVVTVSVPSIKPSIPVAENITQAAAAPHVEEPTTKNTSPEKATTALPPVNSKNAKTHDTINATTSVDNKTENATVPLNSGNSTQGVDNKNETIPATGKNTIETPPTPTGPTITSSTSATNPAPSTAVTTSKPPTDKQTTTTVAPSTPTTKDSVIGEQSTPAPPAQENHFHVGSFVGGIVLSMGLAAILFIAIKYYKSGKIDMNYRTL